MRILMLAPHPFFKNRGTPIAVKLLLSALSEQGHFIDVLTFPEGERGNIRNVDIFRVTKIPMVKNIPIGFSWKKVFYDSLLFLAMIKRLRKTQYDLIHAVEESAFLALIGKYFYKIPYIYDMDSSIPLQMIDKYPFIRILNDGFSKIEGIMIRNSAYVIAVCGTLAEVARRHKDGGRIAILEDIPLFENAEKEKVFRLAEIFGINGPIVMYVGNLERYQGIDLLLDSFELVLKQNDCIHLVIVGGAERDIAYYKEKVRSMNIELNVHFLGPKPIEELPKYLAEADILVSPRIKGENTPMKIYSYMFSKQAIVATRLITHTQVLNDENAVLVDPHPHCFAAGLITLLKDPSLRDTFGKNAAKDIEEKYSFTSFKHKINKIYHTLEISEIPNSALKADLRRPQ